MWLPPRGGAPAAPAQGVYKVTYTPMWKRSLLSVEPGADGKPGPLDNAVNRPLHDLAVELALRGALMATYYAYHSESASGGLSPSGEEKVWEMPSRTFLRHNVSAVEV